MSTSRTAVPPDFDERHLPPVRIVFPSKTATTGTAPQPAAVVVPEVVEPELPAEPLADILDDLSTFLTDHVRFTGSHDATAVALWIAHTWKVNDSHTTPRLVVHAATRESGKTRLLELLEATCPRPRQTGDISAPGLARIVEAIQPTLLLDEYQNTFGSKSEKAAQLTSVINTGYRKGGHIDRCVPKGDDYEVRSFKTFAAVAMFGKGWPPGDIVSRSIRLTLKPRKTGEKIHQHLGRMHARGEVLARRLEAWAKTVTLSDDPVMPDGIVDRPAEVWMPLVAVGDTAGTEWAALARVVCQAKVSVGANTSTDPDDLGVRLLGDLKTVFGTAERAHTGTLLVGLQAIEEGPWRDVDGYKTALDGRRMAELLSEYDIGSKDVKIEKVNRKGYVRSHFEDAWSRHL